MAEAQPVVGIPVVGCERGTLSRTAFIFGFICRTHSTLEGLVVKAADMRLSAYSARSRMPLAVCTLPGGWFDREKSRGKIAACFLLLVTVVGTDVG